MSRRVALVSIDPTWEDPSGEFTPFTYGVRKLEAAIVADPSLQDVEVKVIDLRSADPEAFVEAIAEFKPTLLGASLFAWSIAPFMKLAERVRALDPTIRIVVGGPHARRSVFEMPRYAAYRGLVDAAIEGEGEGVICALAGNHLDDDWLQTPGLMVPHALGWRASEAAPRVDLEAYPSPYELDLAPRGFTGYLETFRGCPIHCSFCQWGEQAADRVYSKDALVRHLEGLRRARVPNVFNLDAAFNLSPRAFRNLAAAEAEVGVLAETTVHGHLYPTLLRHEHLALLNSFGRAQVSIGVQSFDPEVLTRLGRPFDVARFERVLADLRGHVPIELELMLGLPGDTPEGFRETFHHAIAIADTVKVFWTLVLPDALLDRSGDDALRFDPDTWLIDSCTGWTNEALHAELAYVKDVARRHERAVIADFWAGFALERDDAPKREAPMPQVNAEAFVLPSILHRSLGDVERADAILRVMDSHGVDESSLEASIRGTRDGARIETDASASEELLGRRLGGWVRGGRMMLEDATPALCRDVLGELWAGAPVGEVEDVVESILRWAARPHARAIVGWDARARASKLYLNLSDASEVTREAAAREVLGCDAGAPHVLGLNFDGDGVAVLKAYTQHLEAPAETPEPLLTWASEVPIAGWVSSVAAPLGEFASASLRAVFAAPRDGAGSLRALASDADPQELAEALPRAWPFEPGCLRSVGFDPSGSVWTAYAKPAEHSTTVSALDPAIVVRLGACELGLYRDPATAEKAYARTERHALSYRVREGEPERDEVERVMRWFTEQTRRWESTGSGETGELPGDWHVL